MRYTLAYGEFVGRCEEVLLLVKRAAAIERSKTALARGKEIDALCRGALVLLSSHVEAYIKELGESLLDAIFVRQVCRSKLSSSFFYHCSRAHIEKIRDASDIETISADIFDFIQTGSDIWKKTGGMPRSVDAEAFNFGFANPKFERIKKYLGRFGYTSLRHDMNRALKADCVLIIGNLDQIVDIRNAIAHGEASAKKTPSEVKDFVMSAKTFCRTVDAKFSSWCSVNICPIR